MNEKTTKSWQEFLKPVLGGLVVLMAAGANYGVALGKYNSDPQSLFVVGNGADENTLSDCFKVDGQGKLWFMHNGNLTDLSTLLNTHNIT